MKMTVGVKIREALKLKIGSRVKVYIDEDHVIKLSESHDGTNIAANGQIVLPSSILRIIKPTKGQKFKIVEVQGSVALIKLVDGVSGQIMDVDVKHTSLHVTSQNYMNIHEFGTVQKEQVIKLLTKTINELNNQSNEELFISFHLLNSNHILVPTIQEGMSQISTSLQSFTASLDNSQEDYMEITLRPGRLKNNYKVKLQDINGIKNTLYLKIDADIYKAGEVIRKRIPQVKVLYITPS